MPHNRICNGNQCPHFYFNVVKILQFLNKIKDNNFMLSTIHVNSLPFSYLLVRLFCFFPDVLSVWHLAAGRSSQSNMHRKITLAMCSFMFGLKESKRTFSGLLYTAYSAIKTLDVEKRKRKCPFIWTQREQLRTSCWTWKLNTSHRLYK